MLNLLGCSNESFIKLLKQMDYKVYERNKEYYIKYIPNKKNKYKNYDKKDYSNNPFGVLTQLNLK